MDFFNSNSHAQPPTTVDGAQQAKKRRKRGKKKNNKQKREESSSESEAESDGDDILLGPKIVKLGTSNSFQSKPFGEAVAVPEVSKGVLIDYEANHMGDPIEIMIDEIVAKLSSINNISREGRHRKTVQAVVAQMWERQEKYDSMEEVLKNIQLMYSTSNRAPVATVLSSSPAHTFSPTIAPSSGSKAKPNSSPDRSRASTSGESKFPAVAVFPGLTSSTNANIELGGLLSSHLAAANSGPLSRGGGDLVLSSIMDDGMDLLKGGTPPGLNIPPPSPMSVSIVSEKLEKIACGANIYEAVVGLCSFLATKPSGNQSLENRQTMFHLGRVKLLLESKALELLFQQIFNGDNSFLQKSDNCAALTSLFSQVFRIESSAEEFGATINHAAVNEILHSLTSLNRLFIALKSHCKQTFAIGPLAVARRISNTVRKVHGAMVSVFAGPNAQMIPSPRSMFDGSSMGNTVGSAVKVVDDSQLCLLETLEGKLLNLDSEVDHIQSQLEGICDAGLGAFSLGESDGASGSTATLGKLLEKRELEADRLSLLLKYVSDVKTMQKLIEPIVASSTVAIQAKLQQVQSHRSTGKVPKTPHSVVTINLNANDELLAQGLLTDCGETQISLESKTANQSVLNKHMELLLAERTKALEPLNSRATDINSELNTLYTKQAEVTALLADINRQISSFEGAKSKLVQTIADTDSQFKAKLASLELANNMSLASFELKDTVSAIMAEVRSLDAVIMDGAGVGAGAHTTRLWQEKQTAEDNAIDSIKENGKYVERVNSLIASQLSKRIGSINDSLVKFISMQTSCVGMLSQRMKQSLTKIGHLKAELAAYKQLGLQHMINDTELSIANLSLHVAEDREAIVQLQDEIVANISTITSFMLPTSPCHIPIRVNYPIATLKELCVWVDSADVPVASELRALVKASSASTAVTNAGKATVREGPSHPPSATLTAPSQRAPELQNAVEAKKSENSSSVATAAVSPKLQPAKYTPQATLESAQTKPALSAAAAAAIAAATAMLQAAKQSSGGTRGGVMSGGEPVASAEANARGNRNNGTTKRESANTRAKQATKVTTKPVDTSDALASVFKRNANVVTKSELDARAEVPVEISMSYVAPKKTVSTGSVNRSDEMKSVWQAAKQQGAGPSHGLRDIQQEQSAEAQQAADKIKGAKKQGEISAPKDDIKGDIPSLLSSAVLEPQPSQTESAMEAQGTVEVLGKKQRKPRS